MTIHALPSEVLADLMPAGNSPEADLRAAQAFAEWQAEDEQAHWEEDPDYLALYFPTDVEMGMYDDDPNPYHGDYSEM